MVELLPIVKLRCWSCGHIWKPRNEVLPVCCPRCKTYNWREDRLKDEYQKQLKI